ncbi:MAG: type II secretion system protein [Candidatus Omnitrophica bacterium]|nr:type II secretion system protein [Candidatus Omnitrophota bacterium]
MKKGFTLLELIVVIVILGILATLGYTQYTKTVEKARVAEVKMIFGNIRTQSVAYYLERGSLSGLTNADLGIGTGSGQIPSACVSTNYFRYNCWPSSSVVMFCYAYRCTAGGKMPNYSIEYTPYTYIGVTGGGTSGCQYNADGSSNSQPWCNPNVY